MKTQSEIYFEIKSELKEIGVYHRKLENVILQYSIEMETYLKANDQIVKNGELYLNEKGIPAKNPYLQIRQDSIKILISLQRLLGLEAKQSAMVEKVDNTTKLKTFQLKKAQ